MTRTKLKVNGNNNLKRNKMNFLKLSIKVVLCALLLPLFAGSAFSQAQVVLQEDFSKNTSNVSGLKQVTLTSGIWDFFYVQAGYNSVKQCAVLNYSSRNMGYIISPAINKPGVLTFDARIQNSNVIGNYVEIQKSVNGGTFITVDKILVSGINYQQYSVAINETSSNVRIKFLRSAVKPSESSNYNIIIDNIVITEETGTIVPLVCNKSANAALEVHLDDFIVENSRTCCYTQQGTSQTFVLANVGERNLDISHIKISGGYTYSLGNSLTLPFSLAPCSTATITVTRGSSATPIGMLIIGSNDVNSPFKASVYAK